MPIAAVAQRVVGTWVLAFECSGDHLAAAESQVMQRSVVEHRERVDGRTDPASCSESRRPALEGAFKRGQGPPQPAQFLP